MPRWSVKGDPSLIRYIALPLSQAVARRHALNRQRAFVIDADSHSTMFARHPASHLTASLVRQAQQEYKAATGARDEEELLDSIFEEPVFEMSKQEELAALFSVSARVEKGRVSRCGSLTACFMSPISSSLPRARMRSLPSTPRPNSTRN